MITRAAGLMLAVWLAATVPAQASVWLSERGDTAWLAGEFDVGDDTRFKAFLERPRQTPLRVLYLSSYGGRLTPAVAMARLVRKAGLTTAVDADATVCDSACTLLFVAGTRRHYIGGERVREGNSSLSGLGFHPAHHQGDRSRVSVRSDRGSDILRDLYVELGVPRVVTLIDRAAINTIFRPSGQTALRLGLATSLARP